jgi:hypothetical protein
MKKLTLLLTGLALSLITTAQLSDTCCHKQNHSSFTKGRTPYIYVGPELSFPIQTASFGYSAEIGLWGTEKATTLGFVGDYLIEDKTNSFWFGIKGYLTLWQNSNSVYMIYISPKIDEMFSLKSPNLLFLLQFQ